MKLISLNSLRLYLKTYQKRLRAGDRLPSVSELSDIAGVHRDTIYALMAGDRVNERSQYAISKALTEVMESKWNQPSRLLSIDLGSHQPRLRVGLVETTVFKNSV